MSEIHNGIEAGRGTTQLDDLVKSAELIYFAHSFKSEMYFGISDGICNPLKGITGKEHSLIAADLCRASAMYDYRICSEKLGSPYRFFDIIETFQSFFRVCTRQR